MVPLSQPSTTPTPTPPTTPSFPQLPLAVLILAFLLPHTPATPCLTAAPGTLEPVDRPWIEEHYTKYEVRIPMRDGVRLHTTLFAPKDTSTNYPIWFLRTPYGLKPYGSDAYPESHPLLHRYARDRFIFALQDVRGRFASEGEFVHARPIQPHKTQPSDIDESTDAWDSMEWMIQHVPHHNGRIGMSGISYPGFYAACGAIDSHPALKAVSPQAPVSDWFIGDDFHHNGALYLAHAFHFLARVDPKLEKPTREPPKPFDYETPDGYEFYLKIGPLRNVDPLHFEGRVPFWNDLMSHGAYDAFWQARNLRPRLKNIRAPMLVVGGWYDAEDLFGTLEVYRSVEQLNPGLVNTLVMGPWSHGQWLRGDGARLGHIGFRAKTAEFYQQNIELPFFRHHLKDAPNPGLPEAFVFETGTCQWRRFDHWPPTNAQPHSLFLAPDSRLSFDPPPPSPENFDEFVSDPARPVPYIPNIAISMTDEHMLDDQRFASSRPDVLTFQTDPLDHDLTLAGPITVSLHVSTTGTDADWIVKLIDVYPGDYPNPDPNPAGVQMGGYQQLVRGEPMRGKFRRSFEHPEPFTPGEITPVAWTMPDVFHTFRRGHRIMVHVQSSWFPLVDRNPQTFCDIYHAQPEDFRKATHRIHRQPDPAVTSRLTVLTLPTL